MSENERKYTFEEIVHEAAERLEAAELAEIEAMPPFEASEEHEKKMMQIIYGDKWEEHYQKP